MANCRIWDLQLLLSTQLQNPQQEEIHVHTVCDTTVRRNKSV